MFPLFKLFFREKALFWLEFGRKGFEVSEAEYTRAYKEQFHSPPFERVTDLNNQCIDEILKNVIGKTVLDAGCGMGYLAHKIAQQSYEVTAADLVIDDELITQYPHINFVRANVEDLPFSDKSFDTVVCTHTIEHVQHFERAISELRRVTKKRLIIVLPKQRPYLYTFDAHLRFFPHPHSFLTIMAGQKKDNFCREVGGDLFYLEDNNS